MSRPIHLPGANPYQDGWNGRGRRRIDARPQNAAVTQAGMRGVHRDTKGNVIGGYTAEGEGIGTKGGNWRAPLPMTPEQIAAAQAGQPVTTSATVTPNTASATPAPARRSWKDGAGIPGSIGSEIGTKPNATGGGLWRWHSMNPYSGKFGQQRPMAPGEIRDAPLVAKKALGPQIPAGQFPSAPASMGSTSEGPRLPPTQAPVAPAPQVAQSKGAWKKRTIA